MGGVGGVGGAMNDVSGVGGVGSADYMNDMVGGGHVRSMGK